MAPKRHIRFYEYSGAVRGSHALPRSSRTDLGLTPAQWRELAELADSVRPGTRVIDVDSRGARAKHFVGGMAGESISVEIWPKLLRNRTRSGGDMIVSNLSFMLEHAYELDMSDGGLVDQDVDHSGFIEAYIGIFAKRVMRRLRRGGFPKQYVSHADDLRMVRGRIDIAKNVSRRSIDDSKISCVYDDLSDNWALNQAVKYVCAKLAPIARKFESERILVAALATMHGVDPKWWAPSDLRARTTHIHDREMRALIHLTELFLSGMRPSVRSSDGRRPGGDSVFGLIFDMNELFESFVCHVLKGMRFDFDAHVVAARRTRMVEAEKPIGSPVWNERERFDTFSDIVVRSGDGTVCLVIDTKYKIMDLEHGHFGISNSDVYQIMAYEMIHRQSGNAAHGVLLYPQVGDHPVRMKYKVRGGRAEFAVASLDLGRDLRCGISAVRAELHEIVNWVRS